MKKIILRCSTVLIITTPVGFVVSCGSDNNNTVEIRKDISKYNLNQFRSFIKFCGDTLKNKDNRNGHSKSGKIIIYIKDGNQVYSRIIRDDSNFNEFTVSFNAFMTNSLSKRGYTKGYKNFLSENHDFINS